MYTFEANEINQMESITYSEFSEQIRDLSSNSRFLVGALSISVLNK
jgi:hypothetical protein